MHRRILPLTLATMCLLGTITSAWAERRLTTSTLDVAAPVSAVEADPLVQRALEQVQSALAEQAAQVTLTAQPVASVPAAGDTSTSLVDTAMGFLGVKYRRGGNSAETGFDCSGFVRAIYQKTAGLVLPRIAKDQAASTEVIDKKDLKPGDLVFFNTMRRAFSHVGIYLGDGKFIHSPRTGQEVRVESLQTHYWKQRFNGARRVAQDAAGDTQLAFTVTSPRPQ